MKKLAIITITLGIMTSCMGQWKKVRGNGNMTTIERSTGDYDKVSVSGWFDVILVDGNEGRITLEGEENLLEYVVTEVKNGVLKIKTERGINLKPSRYKDGITITVPIEEIGGVVLSGSGDIIGKTRINAGEFSATVSGSGDVTLDLDANSVRATLSGSGDITLNGSAQSLDATVSGSGDIDAYELETDHVEVTVSGSADVAVTANKSLKGRVSGSGDIHYRGNPDKIDTKTSGSGSVSKG